MSNFTSVYHNGNIVLVLPSVLDAMGLRSGQSITETQLLECIERNAIECGNECLAKIVAGQDEMDYVSYLNYLFERLKQEGASLAKIYLGYIQDEMRERNISFEQLSFTKEEFEAEVRRFAAL